MGSVGALVVEVVHGPAVGHDNLVVTPLVAQDVDEELLAAAARLALKTVVGTHHLPHPCVDKGLERGQIGFPKVARIDVTRIK